MSWVSLRWGALLLTSAAIFLAGYKVAEWRIGSARFKETQAALEALRFQQQTEELLSRSLLDENIKETAKFLQFEQDARVIYQNTIKKVKVYVPGNRACDVPAAAIRLRNDIAATFNMPEGSTDRTSAGAKADTTTP